MKILLAALILLNAGCKMNKNAGLQDTVPQFTPGPPALVYKTKADYNNLVPVILSDDKTKIVSYPHPSDLKAGERYLLPTSLKKGYLLDNKGISQNVAFLKLTYEEYSKFPETPDPKNLMTMILDKDPLKELCDCGNKKAIRDLEAQINQWIKTKKLRKLCKVIK